MQPSAFFYGLKSQESLGIKLITFLLLHRTGSFVILDWCMVPDTQLRSQTQEVQMPDKEGFQMLTDPPLYLQSLHSISLEKYQHSLKTSCVREEEREREGGKQGVGIKKEQRRNRTGEGWAHASWMHKVSPGAIFSWLCDPKCMT